MGRLNLGRLNLERSENLSLAQQFLQGRGRLRDWTLGPNLVDASLQVGASALLTRREFHVRRRLRRRRRAQMRRQELGFKQSKAGISRGICSSDVYAGIIRRQPGNFGDGS